MGHFNLSCAMTGQSLSDTEVVLFPLIRQGYKNEGGAFFCGPATQYKLLTLPIFGYLDSYGQVAPELDFNTQLISNFLDEGISEFVDQSVSPYRNNNKSLMHKLFELNRMKKRLCDSLAETDHVLNGCIVAREAWNHFINYGQRSRKFIDSSAYYANDSEFKTLGFDKIYLNSEEKDDIGAYEDRAYVRKQGDVEYLLFRVSIGCLSLMIRGNKKSINEIKITYGKKISFLVSSLRENGIVFTKEEEDRFNKSYMFNHVKTDYFCERANGDYNAFVYNKNRYRTDDGYIYTFPTEKYLNTNNGRFVIEATKTESEFNFNKKCRFMHDEEFESIRDNIEKTDVSDFCFITLADFEGFYDFSEIEGMPIDKKMFDMMKKTRGAKNVSREDSLSEEFPFFYTELQEVDNDLFYQRLAETFLFESNMNALNKSFQPTNSGLQDGCKKTQKELVKVINQLLKKQ